MMEEAELSLTMKLGPNPDDYGCPMLTIRGEEVEGFADNIEAVVNSERIAGLIGALVEIGQTIRAGSAVAASTGPVTVVSSNREVAPAKAAGPERPEDASCRHGDYEFKEGTSKAGKDYKGWFCTGKATNCKPVWAD